MYKVRAIRQFSDLSSPKAPLRKVGDEWEVDSPERLMGLLGMNEKRVKYAQFVSSTKPENLKREGKQIIIRQGYLYFIGGIETFLYNLTKTYRNKNITILCDIIEPTQIARLSQYADIKIDDHKPIKCDILILGNYDGGNILDRVTADKVYQMVHADLAAMSKHYKINARMPARVDKVICVSDTSKEGVKPYYTGEAEVIYNILDKDFKEDDEQGRVFITLSRATVEKGINRMVQMARAFERAGKKFVWFICCSLSQVKDPKILREIQSIPEFIIVSPSTMNRTLIKGCDYLVQLSDTESFCYSAFEALQRGVPVILTRFPEALNIVKEGENGYTVAMDLSDLDIDKIFNHKPQNITYEDRCDYDKWEKVFKGEL